MGARHNYKAVVVGDGANHKVAAIQDRMNYKMSGSKVMCNSSTFQAETML